jgi:hypothetical protein
MKDGAGILSGGHTQQFPVRIHYAVGNAGCAEETFHHARKCSYINEFAETVWGVGGNFSNSGGHA